jgi:ABC-type cobalamin/Fe3+-siderophores transport system ATPase subunit
MALIRIEHLCVPQRLSDISLSLAPGELLGIIGPNGAGKSTLLQSLAGIQAYQGQVRLNGVPVQSLTPSYRAQQIGFLPQSSQSAWALAVRDVIALGRLPWRDSDQQAIAQAAADTQVSQWLERKVTQLSDGQQARVWLARALAGQPQVLLADEPIASLDLLHQQSILALLRKYPGQQRGVILSIHDLALAARYCDRVCLLHQGQIHALGTPQEVLTQNNLREVYQVDSYIDLHNIPPIIMAK